MFEGIKTKLGKLCLHFGELLLKPAEAAPQLSAAVLAPTTLELNSYTACQAAIDLMLYIQQEEKQINPLRRLEFGINPSGKEDYKDLRDQDVVCSREEALIQLNKVPPHLCPHLLFVFRNNEGFQNRSRSMSIVFLPNKVSCNTFETSYKRKTPELLCLEVMKTLCMYDYGLSFPDQNTLRVIKDKIKQGGLKDYLATQIQVDNSVREQSPGRWQDDDIRWADGDKLQL